MRAKAGFTLWPIALYAACISYGGPA